MKKDAVTGHSVAL